MFVVAVWDPVVQLHGRTRMVAVREFARRSFRNRNRHRLCFWTHRFNSGARGHATSDRLDRADTRAAVRRPFVLHVFVYPEWLGSSRRLGTAARRSEYQADCDCHVFAAGRLWAGRQRDVQIRLPLCGLRCISRDVRRHTVHHRLLRTVVWTIGGWSGQSVGSWQRVDGVTLRQCCCQCGDHRIVHDPYDATGRLRKCGGRGDYCCCCVRRCTCSACHGRWRLHDA